MHTCTTSGIMFRMSSFRLALALLPLLSVGPASAQDWFAVEVIVFEHRADASSTGERFPADPGELDLENATDLQPPTEPRTLRPFEQLRPEQLEMTGALNAIARSSRYEPLVHTGWMQPGLARESALGVRITVDSGVPLPVEPLVIEVPDETVAADAGTDAAPFDEIVADSSGDDPWSVAEQLRVEYAAPPAPQRLRGTVTLALQRFIHINADFILTTEHPLPVQGDWATRREEILTDLLHERIGADEARARLDALNAEPRFEAFRVTESRRVRRGEVHYFDHPRIGVVVMVRQVPPEEVEARQRAYDDAVARALQRP